MAAVVMEFIRFWTGYTASTEKVQRENDERHIDCMALFVLNQLGQGVSDPPKQAG